MIYPAAISSNLHQRFEKELYSYLAAVVRNRQKVLNGMKGIKQVQAWYREAESLSESDIESRIVQKIIDMLVQKLAPYLEKLLIDTFKIEVERLESNKIKIKRIELAIAVKPHVDFVKKLHGKEVLRARITFRFAASAKLENINIHRHYYYLESGSKSMVTEVNIDKFEAPFTISIYGLTFLLGGIPVEPGWEPKELCRKELFKVEHITHYL